MTTWTNRAAAGAAAAVLAITLTGCGTLNPPRQTQGEREAASSASPDSQPGAEDDVIAEDDVVPAEEGPAETPDGSPLEPGYLTFEVITTGSDAGNDGAAPIAYGNSCEGQSRYPRPVPFATILLDPRSTNCATSSRPTVFVDAEKGAFDSITCRIFDGFGELLAEESDSGQDSLVTCDVTLEAGRTSG